MKSILPICSLLLTSMAYGQQAPSMTELISQPRFVRETAENLAARLQASSTYTFLNGAYAPTDSTRIYNTAGKNANTWLAVNPYNVLSTMPSFEWDNYRSLLHGMSNKNTDTIYNFFWSLSLNNWDVAKKTEITDIVGNTTIARTTTVNNASLMEKETRTYEFYNANNKIDSVITEQWNGADWVKANKVDVVYDTLSTEPTYVYHTFDATNDTWNAINKFNIVKDGNVHQELVISNPDTATVWAEANKIVYGYDALGNLISKTFLVADAGNTWLNQAQELYLFNTAGQHIQTERTNWNSTENDWVSDAKSIFEYNAEGLLAHKIAQYFNGANYTNSTKQTLIYDAGKLVTVDLSHWNALEWNLTERTNIEDHRSGNGGHVLVWNQAWNTGNYWESVNSNTKKTYYFEEYTDDGTKIPQLNAASFQMYPNPASQQLNIATVNGKIQQVNIYNVTGALVMTVKLNAATTVLDIAALQSGLYQVQIVTDNGVGTQKLSVAK